MKKFIFAHVWRQSKGHWVRPKFYLFFLTLIDLKVNDLECLKSNKSWVLTTIDRRGQRLRSQILNPISLGLIFDYFLWMGGIGSLHALHQRLKLWCNRILWDGLSKEYKSLQKINIGIYKILLTMEQWCTDCPCQQSNISCFGLGFSFF